MKWQVYSQIKKLNVDLVYVPQLFWFVRPTKTVTSRPTFVPS